MGNGGSHDLDDDYVDDTHGRHKRRNSEDDRNFPTPASLAQAQTEFSKEEYEPDYDENGIPAPFPPPSSREEFYVPARYKAVDKHAREAPISLGEKGYEELVEYLIEPAEDELGKLRACYVWLGSQNIKKINSYLGERNPPSESPMFAIIGMVTTKKYGWCWDIFTKMCRQAGIPCQKVDCKIKGSSYKIGKKVPAVNGYSCLVYVDGTCRVIDPVWGCTAGIAKSNQDKEWTLISEGGNAEDQGDTDFFELDEYWFCTNPEQLIYTHLNVEPITQLLATPVTEYQFDRMAYLTKGFFELGMTDTSHPRCVIDCGMGEAVLEFSMKDPKKLGFGYVLYKSLKDDTVNEFDGKKLKQFVFMHLIKGKLQVRVDLPWIGRYKLRLIGKNYDTGKAHKLCEYILLCTTPKFNAKANPENERDEWGPGAETARMGMVPVGLDGGIVVLEEGEGEVKFRIKDPGKIKIIHKLESEDYEPGELRDYVRQYKTDDEIIFVAKVPEHGNYNFKLHAKGEDEDEYRNICTYLVTAHVGAADITPFPPAPDPVANKIGDVAPKPGDVSLRAVSHPKPVITAPKSGQFDIIMQQEGDLTIPVKHSLEHHSALADDVTNYVMMNQDGDRLTFKVVLPKAGTYSLNMTADVDGKTLALYQYVINADHPKKNARPFPAVLADHGIHGVELIEPKSGVLLEDTKEKFKVKVPGAEKVWVEETDLKPGKKNLWSGEVQTGEGGRNIHISCITEKHPGGVQLFTFQVVTKSVMEEIEAENAAALIAAERRRKELEMRKEEEANAAKEREKEEQQQNQELADQFEENREYFEDEEKKLQDGIDADEGGGNDDDGGGGGGKGGAAAAAGVTALALSSLDEDMKNKDMVKDIHTARKETARKDKRKREGELSDDEGGDGEKGGKKGGNDGDGTDDEAGGKGGKGKNKKGNKSGDGGDGDSDDDGRKGEIAGLALVGGVGLAAGKNKKGGGKGKNEGKDGGKGGKNGGGKGGKDGKDGGKGESNGGKDGKGGKDGHAGAAGLAVAAAIGKNGKGKDGKGKDGSTGGRGKDGKGGKEKDPKILAIEEERKRKREEKARALAEERAKKKQEKMMRIERAMTMIQEGVDEKNVEKLEPGLREATDLRLRGPMVETGKRVFVQESERNRINDAMTKKDLDGIYMALENIETKGLTKPLQKEVYKANQMAVGLQKLHKLRRMILDMDRWTIAEIRSYSRPPPVVHTVLTSALLLLGEDEKTTSEWMNIQALLNTIGPMGLYARVLRFDTDNLNPEITARALEVISATSLKGVRSEGSIGAATFFLWTMGALEQAASARPPDEAPSKPAGWKRQRELFGKQDWMHGGKRYMMDPFSKKIMHGYSENATPRVKWSDVNTPRTDRSNWGASLPGVPNYNPKPGIKPKNVVSKIMEKKLDEKEEKEKRGEVISKKSSRKKTAVQPAKVKTPRSPTKHPATKDKKGQGRDKKGNDGKGDKFGNVKVAAAILGRKQPRRQPSPRKPFRQKPIIPPIPTAKKQDTQGRKQEVPPHKKQEPPPSPAKSPQRSRSPPKSPPKSPSKFAPPRSPTKSRFQIPHYEKTEIRETAPMVDTRWKAGHPAWRNHRADWRAKHAYRKFNWGTLPANNFRNSHLKKGKNNEAEHHGKGHRMWKYHSADDKEILPPVNNREKTFRRTYTEAGLREMHTKRVDIFGKTLHVTKNEHMLFQRVTRHQVKSRPPNPHSRDQAKGQGTRSQGSQSQGSRGQGSRGQRSQGQGRGRSKRVSRQGETKARSAPSNSPRLRRAFENSQQRPQSAQAQPSQPVNAK